MKLTVKGNNTIYGICDMDIIVYSIKAGNKMFQQLLHRYKMDKN